MWARQVVGSSPETIQQFFTEWMSENHFMPCYADWSEWIESRLERKRYRNDEYWASYRRKVEEVMQWRRDPGYQAEMEHLSTALEGFVKAADKLQKSIPKFEIPLAFTPEEEKQILAHYAAKSRKAGRV